MDDKKVKPNEKLKPCPFCGAIPKMITHHFHPQKLIDGTVYERRSVQCLNMWKGCMGQGNIENSREEAIKAWNKRA